MAAATRPILTLDSQFPPEGEAINISAEPEMGLPEAVDMSFEPEVSHLEAPPSEGERAEISLASERGTPKEVTPLRTPGEEAPIPPSAAPEAKKAGKKRVRIDSNTVISSPYDSLSLPVLLLTARPGPSRST